MFFNDNFFKIDKFYREKILEYFFFIEIEYIYSESLEILLIFKLKLCLI